MNPLLETWLVAARDCRKNVRSFKGIVMFGIALLGAVACALLRVSKFDDLMNDVNQIPAEQLHEMKVRALSNMYGDDATGQVLAGAPMRLVFLFYVAVWLAPLLVMIIGFDGISSDLQYRSVRYWTIRTRRASYYAGKFLALWAMIGLVTLVMQLMILGVTVVRADAPLGETFTWGLRFWVTSLPITGAWCGVATLVSSLFRVPMLSLLATAGTFFLLFLLGLLVGKLHGNAYLVYLYPNNFDGWIMSSTRERMLEGLGACLAYIVGTGALGSWLLIQRDV